MIKKLSLALFGSALAFIPFNTVNAEIFTYSLSVEQPTVAVTVTNTTTEMQRELTIDRINPVILLDTMKVENTGDVQTITSIKGTATRTDGVSGGVTLYDTEIPALTTHITVGFYAPGTTTLVKGMNNGFLQNNTSEDYFDTTSGQSVDFDVKLRFHKEFSGSFNLVMEYVSRAK